MGMARMSEATSETAGLKIVMVHSDSKSAAQDGIKVARAWLKANGQPSKLVYFYESRGTQWSNLGRSYVARIAYRTT